MTEIPPDAMPPARCAGKPATHPCFWRNPNPAQQRLGAKIGQRLYAMLRASEVDVDDATVIRGQWHRMRRWMERDVWLGVRYELNQLLGVSNPADFEPPDED